MNHLPLRRRSDAEVDLLQVLSTLRAGWLTLTLYMAFGVLVCVLASQFWPWTWSSEAVIEKTSPTDNAMLNRQVAILKGLGVSHPVTDEWVYGRFVRTFSARDTKLAFLQQSSWFKSRTSGMNEHARRVEEDELVSQIGLEPGATGKGSNNLYPYLIARIRLSDREGGERLLVEYLEYVNERVSEQTRATLSEALQVKLDNARQQLDIARSQAAIARQITITRLGYALSLAKVAGITQPVFIKGSIFHDDPDFPISLGDKGLARKLEILNGIPDMSALSTDVQNQADLVRRLMAINVPELRLTSYHLLSRPMTPVRHDGPGVLLLSLLGALSGLMLAVGRLLLAESLTTFLNVTEGKASVSTGLCADIRERSGGRDNDT